MVVSPVSFRTAGPPAGCVPSRRGLFRRRRSDVPARDRLYLAVRSVEASVEGHLLQYALVDDRGGVTLDACVRTPSPVGLSPALSGPWAPLPEPGVLDMRLAKACRGVHLVAFHRVLQGGLLPPAALAGAAGVDCAWRRFHSVARSRGLRLARGEPLELDDCLARAGLAPPASEDAAARAQAVRALWRWMDGHE